MAKTHLTGDGVIIYKYPDGSKEKVPYKNGIKHGPATYNYCDGSTEKYSYIYGKKQGFCEYVRNDGSSLIYVFNPFTKCKEGPFISLNKLESPIANCNYKIELYNVDSIFNIIVLMFYQSKLDLINGSKSHRSYIWSSGNIEAINEIKELAMGFIASYFYNWNDKYICKVLDGIEKYIKDVIFL